MLSRDVALSDASGAKWNFTEASTSVVLGSTVRPPAAAAISLAATDIRIVKLNAFTLPGRERAIPDLLHCCLFLCSSNWFKIITRDNVNVHTGVT